MSKLTELAALRMQVFALEREVCAECGHTLKWHEARVSDARKGCRQFSFGTGRQVFCKCRAFKDEPTEQLSL